MTRSRNKFGMTELHHKSVMIGALKGKTQLLNKNTVLVFASGVGYKVMLPNRVLQSASFNEETFYYIHTHVKEDALDLYGFLNYEDLALFELLIEVSGIGPKTAIQIMEFDESQIRSAIVSSDVEFFTNIPRIGKKNAQKIIIELKSKIGSMVDLDLTGQMESQTKEVLDVMMNMGFKRDEIKNSLMRIPKELVKPEEKIKWMLREMGKHG